jgi:hypothetical protein
MHAKDNCLKVQQFVKANIQSHNPTTKTAWVIPSTALTLKDNKHFILSKIKMVSLQCLWNWWVRTSSKVM